MLDTTTPFFFKVSRIRSLYFRSSCCLIKMFGTPITIASEADCNNAVFLNQVTKFPRETESSISPKTACHNPCCCIPLTPIELVTPHINISEMQGLFHTFHSTKKAGSKTYRHQGEFVHSHIRYLLICGKGLDNSGKLARINGLNIVFFTQWVASQTKSWYTRVLV